MATADVTIRGGGIFGLSVAWTLTGRGARVRVIDPRGPGAGSSGGIIGALAPHVPENWNAKKAFQLDSLLMAGRFWESVEAASGLLTGYARNGRLQPIADDNALMLARQRVTGADELWKGQAEWRVVRAGSGDWEPQSPTGWLIRDTLTARLHPRQAVQSLAAAVVTGGGEIATEGPDEGAVLWATGFEGLRDLSEALGRPVGNGVKGQAVLLDFDAHNSPQLFVDGLHIVPHADGSTAIGSTSEREFDRPDSTDDQCDTLIARARAALPALAGAREIERWAGVRPRARSRAPMAGAWPGRPGHFILNGGFKIGFGMAPKLAMTMADLLLDGVDSIPPDFRPEASM